MPKPIIFTPTALARIRSLVEQGLSAAAIADEIGCTLGSLRVRCSQLGIRLRPSPYPKRAPAPEALRMAVPLPGACRQTSDQVEQLNISLPHVIAEQLRDRAARANLSEADLAAELLVTISRDNLYQAVLDD